MISFVVQISWMDQRCNKWNGWTRGGRGRSEFNKWVHFRIPTLSLRWAYGWKSYQGVISPSSFDGNGFIHVMVNRKSEMVDDITCSAHPIQMGEKIIQILTRHRKDMWMARQFYGIEDEITIREFTGIIHIIELIKRVWHLKYYPRKWLAKCSSDWGA